MINELLFGMLRHISHEAAWIQAWVGWMILINTASLLYLKHQVGKVTLIAWIANLIFMNLLCYFNGYNRLLGLSHVLLWTPLVLYLLRQRPTLQPRTALRSWVHILLLTNIASLILDYIDVAKYILGDRS